MPLRKINSRRLLKEDIEKPCKELSLYLLGKLLVRKLEDETILKGRIVETESYLGGEDKGSSTYNGRRTPANEPLYMPTGTSFIYMTYGMYHCFNISSIEPGAGVLLRALEPICGIETMTKLRAEKTKSNKVIESSKLCDGPSKLCIAMNITKNELNKVNIADLENDVMWLEDDPEFDNENITIVHTSRIGIASAGIEWASKPLRYYILNNESVSKQDKKAEKELDNIND